MSDFTCSRCRTPYFGNPLADTLWRCTCTPTPDRSAPAGEADDALLSGPSVAELTDAAKAAAVLLGCFVGGLVGVGFLGMWLRDVLRT